jgi:hypothetical protein
MLIALNIAGIRETHAERWARHWTEMVQTVAPWPKPERDAAKLAYLGSVVFAACMFSRDFSDDPIEAGRFFDRLHWTALSTILERRDVVDEIARCFAREGRVGA